MMTRDTDLTSNRLFSGNDIERIRRRNFIKNRFIENIKHSINDPPNTIELVLGNEDEIEPLEESIEYKLARAGIFASILDKEKYKLIKEIADSNSGISCCRCGRVFSVIGLFDKRYGIKSEDDPLMCTICEEELRKERKLKEIILSLK